MKAGDGNEDVMHSTLVESRNVDSYLSPKMLCAKLKCALYLPLLLSCLGVTSLAFNPRSLNYRHSHRSSRPGAVSHSLQRTGEIIESSSYNDNILVSRRQFFFKSAAAFALLVGSPVYAAAQDPITAVLTNSTNIFTNSSTRVVPQQQQQQQQQPPPKPRLEPIDIQKVVQENKINITLTCEDENENAKVYIDRTSFDKFKERTRTYPSWIPSSFLPKSKPQIIGRISDGQLLVASALAGSFTEIVRSCILYPITTIKTRVQAAPPSSEPFSFQDMVPKFVRSIAMQTKSGNLYAGYWPSLITSVPASGIYYGVSDVMKREIRQHSNLDELSVILLAVLVADVVSLAVRTPAVIFSVRRQAADMVDVDGIEYEDMNVEKDSILDVDAGIDMTDEQNLLDNYKEEDWWHEFREDCWHQLPIIIITDLPYLLLKLSIRFTLAQGNENIAQYEVLNSFAASLASTITTPFDVARTRILVDSDRDASNGIDGGSGEGVFEAMNRIMHEGTGDDSKPRIQNLYAGWFERLAYFGIGIAWLEPIRGLLYYGIRDLLLLTIFP